MGRPKSKVIYRGQERVLAELCHEKGLAQQTVYQRLKRGLSIEDAVKGGTILTNKIKKLKKHKAQEAEQMLVDIFFSEGQHAFEAAIKEEVQDPNTVLKFYEKYIMPQLKQKNNEGKAGAVPAAIVAIDMRYNND